MSKRYLGLATLLAIPCLLQAEVEAESLFSQDNAAAAQYLAAYQPQKSKALEVCRERPESIIFPSARGCPANEGFFITGDALIWMAYDFDLFYAPNYNNTDPQQSAHRDYFNLPVHWDGGFRLGAGWNTPYDGWDLFLNWTWFHNSTKLEKNEPTNGSTLGLFETYGHDALKYNLVYRTFDLEIARQFYLNRYFSARFYFGPRGASINRKSWLLVDERAPEVTPNFLVDKYKYFTWGLGPRVGFDAEWSFIRQFRAYGNFSAAVLFGTSSSHFIANQLNATPNAFYLKTGVIEVFNQTQDFDWYALPTVQAAIGLMWGQCIFAEKMFASVKAGWEVNYWWDLPTVKGSTISHVRNLNPSDLFLVGFTISAKVDF